MCNNLISDIRNFTFRIGYETDVNHLYNRVSSPGCRRNDPKVLTEILNSKESIHTYAFRSLHDRVQMLNENTPLKRIWNVFYDVISRKDTLNLVKSAYKDLVSAFPPHRELGIFSDTDLVLFADDCSPDSLPLNGIKRVDFQKLEKTYFSFLQKLKFEDYKAPDLNMGMFWTQVHRDIRVLMSRPLGRELIETIDEALDQRTDKIKFFPSDVFECDSDRLRIGFAVSKECGYVIFPSGEVRSVDEISYIGLAHELIHLMHEFAAESDHIDDPHLDLWMHTSPEEMRTIHGYCGCPNHPYQRISENSLKKEFDQLPPTYSHRSRDRADDSDNSRFDIAARIGADGDMIDLVDRVSPDTIVSTSNSILFNDCEYRTDPDLFGQILKESSNLAYHEIADKIHDESNRRAAKRARSSSPDSLDEI